jgi:hypothetical protein
MALRCSGQHETAHTMKAPRTPNFEYGNFVAYPIVNIIIVDCSNDAKNTKTRVYSNGGMYHRIPGTRKYAWYLAKCVTLTDGPENVKKYLPWPFFSVSVRMRVGTTV